jgi:carboxyl-terminal processing protease
MNRHFAIRPFQLIIVITIAILIGYYVGTHRVQARLENFRPVLTVESQTPPASQNLDMKLFYQAVERVNRDYYDRDKIKSQEILYGAVSGMLQSLDDPYTAFFPPKENSEFKTQLAGEFQGIGAELGLNDEERIIVVAPLDNSPAQKAGLKTGDMILGVNKESTSGWTIPQAVEKIRGPKGEAVNLTVLPEGEKETKELKVVRDVIQVDSVKGWVRTIDCTDKGCVTKKDCPDCESIAYIRLSQFGDRTNTEWITVINATMRDIEKQKNFKGVVLDLRNNPGGYLTDAVYIGSEFVEEGTIVMQENNTKVRNEMKVIRKGVMTDLPVVVLINQGSASASEIVAGALRDHERATLVGENSFGKGTVQEAVEIGNGASIHISVAKWLTPNGTWVHKTGLKPDVVVEYKAPPKGTTPEYDNQMEAGIKELLKK